MVQVLPKHRAREYETIFIVHPDVPQTTMEQISGRMTEVIERLEGKLLRAENWGKRRLAYNVAKQAKGTYVYMRYLGYSDMVLELERNLRMLEPVIKHQTIKVDEDVNPDSRPVLDGDISFMPLEPEREAKPASEEGEAAPKAEEAAVEAAPAEESIKEEAAVEAAPAEEAKEEAAVEAAPAEEAKEEAKKEVAEASDAEAEKTEE